MTCPFCGGAMKSGTITVDKRGLYHGSGLFWHDAPKEGEKKPRLIIGFGLFTKNIVSGKKLLGGRCTFEGYSCPECKKIIMDAELEESEW